MALKEDEQQLGEVTITAVERKNTEVAMVQLAKNSSVIVSNISAQKNTKNTRFKCKKGYTTRARKIQRLVYG